MQRTFASYNPRSGRDLNADRGKVVISQLGSITATTSKMVFRAPSVVKLTRISLISESTVSALNESYWSFQIKNSSKGNLELFSTAPTTQNSGAGAITAKTEFDLGTIQNKWLAADDVLTFTATKTASAPNMTRLAMVIEYEVEEGPIPSADVTTTSTSTTTTTTTTTSTTTTVTTTSSSTTTTSSSTSTTTTTSTSSTTTTTSSSTTTTVTTTSSSTTTTTTTSTTVTTTSSSTTTTSSSSTTTNTTSTSTTVTTTTSTSTTVTTTSSSTTITTSTTLT